MKYKCKELSLNKVETSNIWKYRSSPPKKFRHQDTTFDSEVNYAQRLKSLQDLGLWRTNINVHDLPTHEVNLCKWKKC
jgi:hypothetical protein